MSSLTFFLCDEPIDRWRAAKASAEAGNPVAFAAQDEGGHPAPIHEAYAEVEDNEYDAQAADAREPSTAAATHAAAAATPEAYRRTTADAGTGPKD